MKEPSNGPTPLGAALQTSSLADDGQEFRHVKVVAALGAVAIPQALRPADGGEVLVFLDGG